MKILRQARLGCSPVIVLAAILCAPASARQSDRHAVIFISESQGTLQDRQQELDALFAKLREKSDDAGALSAERQIWSLWMQSDSADQDKLLAQATNAMNIRDFRLSEELLSRLIVLDKDYAEAWNKRATLYYLMGRHDASLADIVKTLDLEPRHFGALSGRGMILKQQGKMPEALAAYREAYAINPHMPGVAAAIKELEALMPDL
jgi:tetratricopeptide (TPR) repeat protein